MTKRNHAQYLPYFRDDLKSTLIWSKHQFGLAAARRYSVLIRTALRDLLDHPLRPGAKARPDLAPDAYTYHLMFSRARVPGERVKAPRHLVVYRFKDSRIEFARLLHDSRDVSLHLPEDYRP